MGIINFFRRKRAERHNQPVSEYDAKKALGDDPYDEQINRAIKLQAAGKIEAAEKLFREIVKEKAEHVRAWFLLAEHFLEINQLGRALYCYEKIIQYQPINQKARMQSAKLTTLVRERPDYLWEYNQERGLI